MLASELHCVGRALLASELKCVVWLTCIPLTLLRYARSELNYVARWGARKGLTSRASAARGTRVVKKSFLESRFWETVFWKIVFGKLFLENRFWKFVFGKMLMFGH